VGRENRRRVGQHPSQLARRGVLRADEVAGVLRPEQVRAAGRPVQQRAAGEDCHLFAGAGVGEHVGQVSERVARRGDRGDPHPRPDLDGFAVAHRGPLEGHLVLGVDQIRGAGAPGEGEAAGDVVVMDVGLEDVRQPQAILGEQGQDAVDVPLRVHHEGNLAVMHEVTAVAQRGRLQRDYGDGIDVRHACRPVRVRRRPPHCH